MRFERITFLVPLLGHALIHLLRRFRSDWWNGGPWRALRRFPGRAFAILSLFRAARSSDPLRRVQSLRTLAVHLSHCAAVHALLGNACFLAGRYFDALSAYARAMRRGDRRRRTWETFAEAVRRVPGVDGAHWTPILADLDHLHRNPAFPPASTPATLYPHGELLLHLQRFEEVLTLANRYLQVDPGSVPALGLRARALERLGLFEESLRDAERVCTLDPDWARRHDLHLLRAFLHGRLGNTASAARPVADHFLTRSSPGGLADFLASSLEPRLRGLHPRGTLGLFFSMPIPALGHVVLDAFQQWNLHRHRFDHLVLVHGPKKDYSPAGRSALEVLAQHVDLLEIGPDPILKLAWQSLGELPSGRCTFLIHHYWSLARLTHHGRTREGHSPPVRRLYLQLPPRMIERAENILRRPGIDPDRPLVVFHVREHDFHRRREHAHRNADVENYRPALQRLLEEGYQVVRIGDAAMQPLGRASGVLELPFLPDYEPLLDPYLISRADFFIGCQSGPCSWARALGKPNLILNAVFDHSLIPETRELVAFKTYLDAATGEPLSLQDILLRGCPFFHSADQFRRQAVQVREMTAEEIYRAVEEMLAWHREPDAPESPFQARFRDRLRKAAAADHPLRSPLQDYIGYTLPECRVSELAARLHPGFRNDAALWESGREIETVDRIRTLTHKKNPPRWCAGDGAIDDRRLSPP